MRSVTVLICLITLSIAAFPAQTEEARVASNDIERLAKLIHLPAPPKSVRWMWSPLGGPGLVGPTDYSLLAILEYDDATCEAILSRSPRAPPNEPLLLAKEEVADWLPAELRSDLVRESDDYYRVKGTAFEPELFTRSPLLVGHVVRIEHTNFLLVALQTS